MLLAVLAQAQAFMPTPPLPLRTGAVSRPATNRVSMSLAFSSSPLTDATASNLMSAKMPLIEKTAMTSQLLVSKFEQGRIFLLCSRNAFSQCLLLGFRHVPKSVLPHSVEPSLTSNHFEKTHVSANFLSMKEMIHEVKN
eukprot:747450-Hanusia_phi.AAC.1